MTEPRRAIKWGTLLNYQWLLGESVENEPSDYYLVHNTKCIALLGVSQSSNCCPKI